MIILNRRNIKIVRLNKSLDYKNIDSYKIIKILKNITYKLNLSQSLKIHLVFYL